MIQAGTPQRGEQPRRPDDREAVDMDVRVEVEEGMADHEVGEAVIDDEDVDTAFGRSVQRIPEPPSGRVGLPDVGFQEDLFRGALDGGNHVGIKVLAVGVDLRLRVRDAGIVRAWTREPRAFGPLPALEGIEDDQPGDDGRLQGREGQCQSSGRFFQGGDNGIRDH